VGRGWLLLLLLGGPGGCRDSSATFLDLLSPGGWLGPDWRDVACLPFLFADEAATSLLTRALCTLCHPDHRVRQAGVACTQAALKLAQSVPSCPISGQCLFEAVFTGHQPLCAAQHAARCAWRAALRITIGLAVTLICPSVPFP
jgi:hypothetical protein